MDKSKGEPVISVKATSRSKDRVSIEWQVWALAVILCPALPTSRTGTEAWAALAEMGPSGIV